MDAAAIKASTRDDATPGWDGAAIAFSVFAALAAALTWPTVPDMARTWLGSSYYHHGVFVAPVAAWMIFAHSARPQGAGRPDLGLLIIVAGAALWLVGRAGGAAIIEQLAFVTILIGAVGAVYGHLALRHWAWPLGFLFFMVPAGASLLPWLQFATAKMVVGALSVFGFAISVDGVIIHTSVGAFAIAEACAGLNVLIAAIMVSTVFAYVSFQGWGRRAGFIAFAALFAIIANAVRAFFLILFPLLIGEQADIGPDHYVVGWMLYFFVLVALALIGRRFANRSVQNTAPAMNAAPGWRRLSLCVAAGYLVTGAVYANYVVDRNIHRTAPATLTLLNTPGWRILPPPRDWRARSPHADRSAAATYVSADAEVDIALSYFTHDRRGAEYTARPLGDAGADWDRIGHHEGVLFLFGTARTVNFARLIGPQNQKRLALTVYWLGDDIYFNARNLKRSQAAQKLRGDNREGGVITLAAPYAESPDDALRAIGQFTADVEDFSDWRARLARK